MTTISTVKELTGYARKSDLWKQITDFTIYPKLIPQIDSIRIIEQGQRKSSTEWFITLDGAPFSWVEFDTFKRERYTFCYEAVSGDFDVFRGEVKIDDNIVLNGIRLTCSLNFELGIPVIEEHCGDILKEKFQHYINSIVEHHSGTFKKRSVDERRFKRVRVDRFHSFFINGRTIEAKVLDFSCGGMSICLTKGMLGTEPQRAAEFGFSSKTAHGRLIFDEQYQIHRIHFDSPLDDASFRDLFAQWTDGSSFPDETITIYDVLTAPAGASARSCLKKTIR